ncbi:aldo/keto reductase [Fulvimonas soli]|jgi:aryl-alcohol dehydrogenase-like predicted oxidoreductase|uniref:Aryl-alcohol dehydrogenase-like predicted oxidoreductase n=1 Tax=Fulvimonas soli TaxID=155197 RepID=A0A316HV26_9GAMM|nr:aldo/keto reductase [Fulvimonas soli]PWK85283.1 aryl-alcohol dehydrogenase-like predicted oxidoreductase [Fulvimonas soli]TNY26291.1 aldo/keto reductase [Fulvimonas soli]
MPLDQYYTLGRSGLRVSRLALGTMTFGEDWGWGAAEDTARAMFDRYLEAGGNFIDTADLYTEGSSERLLGRFIEQSGTRDRVVLATKFTYNAQPGDPNAGGNGRKNIMRAVEGSLRRLRTDYIDLYLLHTWDRLTPAEEVVRTLDDLVRAGKIRYAGLSDVPAWYAARAQTFAEAHALSPLVGLQLEYSLAERNIEHEFVPLALELGMGITAWSPLAMGLLSGKYRPSEGGGTGEGRLAKIGDLPGFRRFTERNWGIVAALEEVAGAIGRPMAQVALNWVATRPAVGSVIVGATKLAQLDDNLAALSFEIPAELRAKLDAASAPETPFPYWFFGDAQQTRIHGGAAVGSKPAGYAPPVWVGRVEARAFKADR